MILDLDLEHLVIIIQVKSLGPTVGCTITIHHLELTVDDWAGCCHNYCKPVAKLPSDRQALRDVVLSAHPRFFLGTDSAPHPRSAKEGAKSAAGVFTGIYTPAYLAHVSVNRELEGLLGAGCGLKGISLVQFKHNHSASVIIAYCSMQVILYVVYCVVWNETRCSSTPTSIMKYLLMSAIIFTLRVHDWAFSMY